ncbi:histidine phosphatase family protein [Patescibacteria group bacterium AH-259-L07]|nr:histidine phosphatase family protein [Patescibacteria group bacterium AH-259-L07]
MQKQDLKNIEQKWPNYLVLVRHGQSIYNEERELVNRGILNSYTTKVKDVRNADVALSRKGKQQAQETAEFLKKTYSHFDFIFASPFKRAHHTARIIAKEYPDTRFIIEERIREKEFGVKDGLTPKEFKKLFPYEYERKQKEKKYYYRPIGGESYCDMNLRIWSFMSTVVREYAKTNILIVSHSAVMLSFRKLLEKLTEEEVLKINKHDDIKNCAIVAYRFDPNLKPKPKLKLDIYNKIAY